MNKKNNIKSIYSNFALLTTAFIWGVSFVAQKSGMAFVGPFTFNAARTFLGGLSLLPVIGVLKMIQEPLKKKQLSIKYLLKEVSYAVSYCFQPLL